MATLAPKLPYTHPFAGGYPYRGSQRLPSDPDALTYLAAVAAADGAPVEVGVATAVDDFFKGCKADGIWDAIKASCILCGARTLAGALVPLAGGAPTNVADGFVSGDYTRGGATPGLQGDGTSYLLSGLPYNAVSDADEHLSAYLTTIAGSVLNISGGGTVSPLGYSRLAYSSSQQRYELQNVGSTVSAPFDLGFVGASRSGTAFTRRNGGTTASSTSTPSARSATATEYGFMAANYSDSAGSSPTTAASAFFSVGSAVNLAALDARVTALVTAIGAAV
jgi:hypothetical protein